MERMPATLAPGSTGRSWRVNCTKTVGAVAPSRQWTGVRLWSGSGSLRWVDLNSEIAVLIPAYWAEAKLNKKTRERSVTVRRFGWSNTSQADAEAMAEARCAEAFERVLGGQDLPRREPKVPYNGAEGLPIREEILATHGDAVITRNAYGAHCLNVPDALFADVDFDDFRPKFLQYLLVFAALSALALWVWLKVPHKPCEPRWILPLLAACALSFVPVTQALYGAWLKLCGGAERLSHRRVDAFVKRHPDWRLRLYRTPAGLRLLALHRRFSPLDPEVTALFEALQVDQVYALMCRRQQCFRARLTGKPWRMGIPHHMKPRPGVWPVALERMADRLAWTREYDALVGRFSACRYVREAGAGAPSPDLDALQELHDELSGALTSLPLA